MIEYWRYTDAYLIEPVATGNDFEKGRATKLSSAWAGCFGELRDVLFLSSVAAIPGYWGWLKGKTTAKLLTPGELGVWALVAAIKFTDVSGGEFYRRFNWHYSSADGRGCPCPGIAFPLLRMEA